MSVDSNKKVELINDKISKLRSRKRSVIFIAPFLPIVFQIFASTTNIVSTILSVLQKHFESITSHSVELFTLILFLIIYGCCPYFFYKIKFVELEIERLEKILNTFCREKIFIMQHSIEMELPLNATAILRRRSLYIPFFMFWFLIVLYIVDVNRSLFWFVCSFAFPLMLASSGIVVEKRAAADHKLFLQKSGINTDQRLQL